MNYKLAKAAMPFLSRLAPVFNSLEAKAFLLWVLVITFGFGALVRSAGFAGDDKRGSASWPGQTHLTRDRARPTLIIFAHPRCPCTRATLGELERIMARAHGGLSAQVLFVDPPGTGAGWARQDGLWRTAEKIPGVELMEDVDGKEARLFGARTSGRTLFYDTEGRLLFQGGITAARGHAGDNAGEDAIGALIANQKTERRETPTFGCSLFDSPAKSP
jgi:hypothetical protein